MTEQRLPTVNGDDGVWGDILNQFLQKEHYDTGTDNAANGGHKTITIRAGTATAGTAPLKFTSGTLLSSAEAGAMEFNSDTLYFTITTSTIRKTIAMYDDSSGATGDIYYRASGGAFTRLPIGSPGDVLKVTGGLPSWGAGGSGSPGGLSGQFQFNDSSAFGGSAGLTYQSGASPNVLATAQNAAHTPLEVRGAASQSANLQEWKNSTPTLLAAIDAAGKLVFGSTGDTNLYSSAANTLATDDDFHIKTGKAIKIDGSSSGTVTIQTNATAGTYTLTLPDNDGGVDDVLKSNGSGVLSWGTVSGGMSWTTVTGTSQAAAVNTGYITNNASLVTVTLPTTAAVGDTVAIAGQGAGGWKLAQNASEVIYFGNATTTTGTGGYLASTHRRDSVVLVCITADTEWEVYSSVGSITYV